MTQEQLLLELFNQSLNLHNQAISIFEQIKILNQKTKWDEWLPHIFQFLSICVAAFALLLTHFQNKKSEQLPYLKLLNDELNDIILAIYDILNDPRWGTLTEETRERVDENFLRTHANFLNGNKYFVISSIPTDPQQIRNRVQNAGRRIMYFNQLKARYVKIYSALDKATDKYGAKQPLFEYFKLTEYEKLYLAFKDMPDI